MPAKYSALAFFFRTSKPVVWRQKYLPEVESILSAWKSYSFQGMDSYSSYPVSRKRAEWQNAHFEWKKKKRISFSVHWIQCDAWIEERIWGKWGCRGQCFKNTAIKQTEVVWLQNESSTFLFLFFSPENGITLEMPSENAGLYSKLITAVWTSVWFIYRSLKNFTFMTVITL